MSPPRIQRYHLRGERGFLVGEVNGTDCVWSKRSYWGQRFVGPDDARNWVRERLGKLAACLDSMVVVRVRREKKRKPRAAGCR